MPRDILRTASRQLRKEIGMRRPADRWTCELAIWLALIGINKPEKVRMFATPYVDGT